MFGIFIVLGLGTLLLGLISSALATAAILAYQLFLIGGILLVVALFIQKTK